MCTHVFFLPFRGVSAFYKAKSFFAWTPEVRSKTVAVFIRQPQSMCRASWNDCTSACSVSLPTLRAEVRRWCALSPCLSHKWWFGRSVFGFLFLVEQRARSLSEAMIGMLHCFEFWFPRLALSRCMVSSPHAFLLRKMATEFLSLKDFEGRFLVLKVTSKFNFALKISRMIVLRYKTSLKWVLR